MVCSKCLQVISRQSNFERLEKCLEKQNEKNNNNRNKLQSSCRRFETQVNTVKEKFEETVYKYQEKEGKKSSVGDWENA